MSTLCDPIDYCLPGFSVYGLYRQEHWNELHFPTLGDLLNLGIEIVSLALAGRFFTSAQHGKLTGERVDLSIEVLWNSAFSHHPRKLIN